MERGTVFKSDFSHNTQTTVVDFPQAASSFKQQKMKYVFLESDYRYKLKIHQHHTASVSIFTKLS